MTVSQREVEIAPDEWQSIVFPLLMGKVFHATRRTSFWEIVSAGHVLPGTQVRNREGLGSGPGNYAGFKGYVALFDFRTRSPQEILEQLSKCHPCQLGDFHSLLVLNQDVHPALVLDSTAAEEVGWSKRRVPFIECWHPSPIPIERIVEVLHVTIRRPRSYSPSWWERAHWCKIRPASIPEDPVDPDSVIGRARERVRKGRLSQSSDGGKAT